MSCFVPVMDTVLISFRELTLILARIVGLMRQKADQLIKTI